VPVSLGERSYRILVGNGLLARLGPECARLDLGPRVAVLTDANVGPRYGQAAVASLAGAGFDPCVITIPAGETAKSLAQLARCYDSLAQHRLERASFLVALGGGVVGDLAGFAAATYLRGIAFVQVPTTLLAQVDSSVGGKTGVNLRAGKNLVGAFHQPALVLCDLETLATLPRRELRAGLAEVIKYGAIRDAALFGRLERDLERLLALEPKSLAAVIARCCELKAEVVAADEREGGLRASLNFGHTVGHALEAVSRYGRYLHGEAIALGQVVAARLSVDQAGLAPTDAERIGHLLARAGLPVAVNLRAAQRPSLLAAMRLDKKVRGGEVRFVLLRRLGEAVWGQAVAESAVARALGPSTH
jgi:3-dehydroquinate synthase